MALSPTLFRPMSPKTEKYKKRNNIIALIKKMFSSLYAIIVIKKSHYTKHCIEPKEVFWVYVIRNLQKYIGNFLEFIF